MAQLFQLETLSAEGVRQCAWSFRTSPENAKFNFTDSLAYGNDEPKTFHTSHFVSIERNGPALRKRSRQDYIRESGEVVLTRFALRLYSTLLSKAREFRALDSTFNPDLYDPFERLVTIELLGKKVEVPEKNRLLRCFQFLSMSTISMGDFCWNGDCANCQIWYREAEDPLDRERTALSCRMTVIEGMVIMRLAAYLQIEGITVGRAGC
jgi:hypothetical protein